MNVDLPDIHFPLPLFCLTLVTGAMWLADLIMFRRSRVAGAAATLRQLDLQNAGAPSVAADSASPSTESWWQTLQHSTSSTAIVSAMRSSSPKHCRRRPAVGHTPS